MRKRVPVADGLFSMPSTTGGARLLANKCQKCGEIYFPKEKVCLRCGNFDLQNIALSSQGTLLTFTVIRQQPPVYKGPVPYAIGVVELPEKVRTTCLITGCDPADLQIGMKMELVIERLHQDDQGNEVVCHKFRPLA